MVFPGLVRRLLKLMPTILQAVALVVFLHIVGQVLAHLILRLYHRNTRSLHFRIQFYLQLSSLIILFSLKLLLVMEG